MNIPATVRTYLLNSALPVRVRRADQPLPTLLEGAGAAGIPVDELVRAVMVRVAGTVLMLVVPAAAELDLPLLTTRLGGPAEPCRARELTQLLPGCDPRLSPPLSNAFGIPAVVDTAIDRMQRVFFTAGGPGLFLHASREEFLALQGDFRRLALTVPRSALLGADARLPAMPGMAQELMLWRGSRSAGPRELARVIERDPSLAAQLMRYARSPLYAYRGRVESVEEAVTQVLGTDFALHMALGIALGRSFDLPRGGRLGLDAYWRHALHCAALCQALATAMGSRARPPRGLVWLAGLLHNFGLLLLGQLAPREYTVLAGAYAAEPEAPLTTVEARVLATGHAELGGRLLEAWRMPPEVTAAAAWHHAPAAAGAERFYPELVALANRLLARVGIGDEPQGEIEPGQCARLGLTLEDSERALAFVLQDESGLGWMAAAMAA